MSLLNHLRADIGDDGSSPITVPILPNQGVSGPGSSTDNAIATFDGTSGGQLQSSPATLDDFGNLVTPGGAQIGGAFCLAPRIITFSGPVSIVSTDSVVMINKTASEATTLTLPASQKTGRMIVIKDLKGDANSNFITIITSGGELLDGLSGFILTQSYQSINLIYNGSGWSIL